MTPDDLQAIRLQLRIMADDLRLGCTDDVNHGMRGRKTREAIRYYLSDHLPEHVIDWVLES